MRGIPKSNREKDLEQRIKDEKDSGRKRQVKRELDDLRHREAENRFRAERERGRKRARATFATGSQRVAAAFVRRCAPPIHDFVEIDWVAVKIGRGSIDDETTEPAGVCVCGARVAGRRAGAG
jgi:hypothetical protein